MLYRLPLFILVLVCGLPLARELSAQSYFPVSTEMSLGFRVGHGGSYVNRGGAAFDMVLGYRLGSTSAGALIGGIAFGAQGPIVSGLECLLLADGECAPEFPVLLSGGALLGVQRGSTRTASARVMAGPMYHQGYEGGNTLGVQGRVDVATPPWHHTAVVASLRHSVLPSFRGETLGVTSFGLGLRIQ